MTQGAIRLSYGTDGAVSIVLSLLAIVLLLYLCYRLSRFLAKKANGITNSNNIRILERVALSQDKGLVIAEICGACYLIGFSNDRVEILKELDESLLKKNDQSAAPDFLGALNSALKGRWDLTGNDRNRKIHKP